MFRPFWGSDSLTIHYLWGNSQPAGKVAMLRQPLSLAYQVPWEQEHFQVEPHAIRQVLLLVFPIGSMGRTVYLPTLMVDFYGKSRQIYQSHGS